MSAQTISKKRKSADSTTKAVKKTKVAKSAEKPAPLKSALKKPRVEMNEIVEKDAGKPKKTAKNVEATAINGDATVQSEKTVVDDDSDGGAELTQDQTNALLAGFSSSEDEGDSEDEGGVAISTLPKAPSTGLVQKRIKQAIGDQNDPETTPGVIYLGRIPHGFFEPQMKAYFSQFGDITRLRLARNKKTGKSQHYAFVEFASAAVADIVVKTMDKYLLFGHILQARRVPAEQVGEGMFKGKRNKKPAPRNALERGRLRRGMTREEWEKRVEKENHRRLQKAEKLKEIGYDFEMPVVKSVDTVSVKGLDIDDGAKLLQEGDVLPVPEAVEAMGTVSTEAAGTNVVEKTETKKRPTNGKAAVKKTVKKVKV